MIHHFPEQFMCTRVFSDPEAGFDIPYLPKTLIQGAEKADYNPKGIFNISCLVNAYCRDTLNQTP
jgi:hypothetical protein